VLTAAVVGCGPRGREHAQALRAVDEIALVGVVDADPARRAAVGGDLGVPTFATLASLLVHGPPHIVVLAIPASGRLPLVELAVQCRGVRALVLEKPMAHRLAEARRIVGLCEDAGVRLVVGHQLRFCPEFVALRDAVDRGELGRLSSLAGWCYGNLLDQGPHLLDLVCWLAGDRKALWVMSQQCSDPDTLRRFTAGSVPRWDSAAHPAPPWMVHQVAFEDGLRATIETGPLHQRSGVFVDDWLQKRMMAVGSEGLAEAQAAGYFRILRDGSARRELPGTLAEYQAATRRFHEELRDVVLRGGTHRNDARGALRSLELVVACAQSAADGSIATWPLDPERDPIAELSERRGGQPLPAGRPGSAAPDVAPRAESGLEFSLLITLPDHYGHAVECVRSWTRDQTYPRDRYEVIIIGNGSEPEVESAVRALLGPHDRFLLIPTDNDLEMCHRGTEVARGRWLLFTEPHCTGEPECLAELADYLGRTTCAGACLRSVTGNRQTMARLEDRMFQEGFADFSRPGDWRKVILRGFVLRSDVYREVGGFEYQFERFSEWALAATLHARGFAVGYAPGAGVKHFNTTSFAQLFPGVASFTRGECAYRAARPAEYCERYFGSPPEWLDRSKLRRDVGREVVSAVWRSSWRDGWGHGALGVRFILAMAREMVAALPSALFGARAHVLGARLGLLVARLRLGWLSVGEEATYRAYRRLWDAMVRFTRLEYLAGHEGRTPTDEIQAVQFNVAELPDDRLTGFHARETWQGRSFRWMGAAGMMRLDVPSGSYGVCLDTGGVVGPVSKRPVGIFWNGHKVSRAGLRCDDGHLSFSVPAEWVVSGRQQTLTLTCAPVSLRNSQESRRLGLPIFGVTLVPRDDRTRRAVRE
jgi:predicted dehydrogenase